MFGMTDISWDVKQSCYCTTHNLKRIERHYQPESYQLTSPFQYKFFFLLLLPNPIYFLYFRLRNRGTTGREKRGAGYSLKHSTGFSWVFPIISQVLIPQLAVLLGLTAGIRTQVNAFREMLILKCSLDK